MTARYRNIFILTGAGISAESGLATFRDVDGLWNNHPVEEIATIEGYNRNPGRVLDFYNDLKNGMQDVRPNAAHLAITGLQQSSNAQINIITQNVDLLHEKAGNQNIYHMHGRIDQYVCMNCKHIIETEADVTLATFCPECGMAERMKPNIVFFGEMPLFMDEIENMLADCELFISIGTSGVVYPAAGFAARAKSMGAETVEFTLDETLNNRYFDKSIIGKAGITIPEFVKNII